MISIRDAKLEDAATIADFQLEMARETEARELDLEIVLPGVEQVLQNPAHGFFLVATGENEVVIAALLVTFEWSEWRNGQFFWIQSVFVAPDFRGRGIYRALYSEVETRARNAKNACGLRLYVERDNQKAQAVYEKLGMSETPYRIYETEF